MDDEPARSSDEAPSGASSASGAFVLRRRVRFHEIDRAGIAYFGRAFQYCHEAFEDMLSQALGHDLEIFFRTSEWMMPLVHAESDYQAPILLGQDLRVELRIARLGGSSVTFAYRVVGEPDEVVRAEVKLVHVCVDRASFQKRALPEGLAAGFKALGLVSEA